ncbi:PREDICTED: ankyrin repeat domain-containing protein 26-like [Chinchilla lanigera]|uniref:ankyrin repeat domain-containing protein 26-like n=1 Tax=Chinchilla lanigera TaxID=34839 RepID=UPI00038F0EF1|nr:PREDICTED: ankyrin repeat domain-containing protein 26-like [Chinchilla lanigera]
MIARKTALHLACAYGHPKVVTYLVERKCDIDACDSDSNTALIEGNTALHFAACSETTSLAEKLLSHNANIEATNKNGLTPLLVAQRQHRLAVVELLEKKKTNKAMDKPASSEPALPSRKVKKNENEQRSSTESVTSSVFQQADSIPGGPLQVKSGCKLNDTDEDEGRSTKKMSDEKSKVKKKINGVDGLDELSQSSETPSKSSESPYMQYENILVLFEQLLTECTDSVSLSKIWDGIQSYKRVLELKKDHDEVLKGKNKKLENKLRGLQKKLSETQEVKSQLEHAKIQREKELGNLRLAVKEEEKKRKNMDQLCEKINRQLRKKEEQYCQEAEAKQQHEVSLRALDTELKTVRSELNRLEEAQDQHTGAVQSAEKMEECIKKLELENSKLKVKMKKQVVKIEHLQKNLLSVNLSEDDKEQLKKLTELKQSLEYTLDEEKKQHGELEKELTGLKELFKTIETKLNEQGNGRFCFPGDLKSSDFGTNISRNTLMHKTQATSPEHVEQVIANHDASIRNQMELRIKDLELELSNMKTQKDFNERELQKYKQLHMEEREVRASLCSELNQITLSLEAIKINLLMEKDKSKSLPRTVTTRPVLECSGLRNLDHSLEPHRNFPPRENLGVRTLYAQPSNSTMKDDLTVMHQEVRDFVARRVRQALQ